ncbi:MAG TPA: hypothetical protein VND41_05330, partial [Nitrososphaerales archaeon]|nr:hypothetical protein [Nitrososphaerales archaeon]
MSVAALACLLSSSSSFGGVHAATNASAPVGQSSADWFGPDGNFPFNWDYSPQTTINVTSVSSLNLMWLFPLPAPRIP